MTEFPMIMDWRTIHVLALRNRILVIIIWSEWAIWPARATARMFVKNDTDTAIGNSDAK